MINQIFIFGAEKLIFLSPLITLWVFYKADWQLRREMMVFSFFSLPLTFILGVLARELYFDPRPFVVGGFSPLISHAPDNGFPSDHTLLLAAVASIISRVDKRYALALWLITIFVAYSRVFVGVHHFIDVVASVIIALVSALAVHLILNWWKKHEIVRSTEN